MSVDISASQLITGVFSLIFLTLGFFIRLWISRLQADLDSAKKAHTDLNTAFHDYQLQCAREFAQKSDVLNGRVELMEAMHDLDRKLDRINDKLDKKADKPS